MSSGPADERSVGVVLPAYDPALGTLEAYVENVRRVVEPATVRIEVDTPTEAAVDQCVAVADSVGISTERRGKGKAIMDGFDALGTDVLAFADADGSVLAPSLAEVVQRVETGVAPVSIASRRHPDAEIRSHQTLVRRLLGDAFAFAAGQVLPVDCTDYQCGAKAVTADAWESIGPRCTETGFAWDLEFLSVADTLGYDIAEVPVQWEDHPDSTVDPVSTSLDLAAALIRARRRTHALAETTRGRDGMSATGNSSE